MTMISWPRIRRSLELLAVGIVVFLALLGVGAVLAPDSFLETAEANASLRRARAQERESARRLGAELESWRHEQLDRVKQSREALRRTRGAFSEEISALALDAAGRLLVGGSEAPDLWLGVIRFERNGSIDEAFVRNIALGFEKDRVVGHVAQVLPLADGRILLRGSFQKPKTFNRRPQDPGSIAFVLLDEEGRVDEAWLEALWPQWPDALFAGNAFLGEGSVVWFATHGELRRLRVDGVPFLSAPGSVSQPRPGAFCRASAESIVGVLDQRLQVFRLDGSLFRDLTPPLPPGSKLRGNPSLFCGEGDRTLALFPLAPDIADFERFSPCPGEPINIDTSAAGETMRRSGQPLWKGFQCGSGRDEPRSTGAATHLLSVKAGEIAAEVIWPDSLIAEQAVYAARLDRWLVYGSLAGPEPYAGLFTILEQPSSIARGPALVLGKVSAMIELPFGDLVIAGSAAASGSAPASRERAVRLWRLEAASDELVPY